MWTLLKLLFRHYVSRRFRRRRPTDHAPLSCGLPMSDGASPPPSAAGSHYLDIGGGWKLIRWPVIAVAPLPPSPEGFPQAATWLSNNGLALVSPNGRRFWGTATRAPRWLTGVAGQN